MDEPHWIERSEAALRGELAAEVELVATHAPTLLDGFARGALLAPFLAAFFWAAVVLRDRMAPPLDPITLLLELLALALTLRVVLLGVAFVRRVRVALARNRYGLALSEHGLVLRTPASDYAVPKHDVIDVRERGSWQQHAGARWADVYVITRPSSGRTHLTLPPVFERTPGALAERLMRWRGAVDKPEASSPREPAELASKLYDAAAAGAPAPGCTPIALGRGFLQRAPYATLLLGLALLGRFAALDPATRARIAATAASAVGLCLFVMPGFWLLMHRRALAPRKGLALLLTPAELLMRGRAGIHRFRWSELARADVAARKTWSIVAGQHELRSVVITDKEGAQTYQPEALLAVPAEVLASLCEAYRRGILP